MQLPQWAMDLVFPAQRYARRRQQAFIEEHRRRHQLAKPRRLTAEEAGQAAPDDEFSRARARAVRDHRLARISSIARDQQELLLAMADDLERTGSARISSSAGEMAARLIRFRWGKDMLDISRTREGQPTGWSLGTVPRSPAPARRAAITAELATALAALEPSSPV